MALLPFQTYCYAMHNDLLAVGGHAAIALIRLGPDAASNEVLKNGGMLRIRATVNSVCFYEWNGQLRLIVNDNEMTDSIQGV